MNQHIQFNKCPKCGGRNLDIEDASDQEFIQAVCLDCDEVITKKVKPAKSSRRRHDEDDYLRHR